ncbi:unnamed protein product [Discula destructiva]
MNSAPSSDTATTSPAPKKSLYQRFKDAKNGPGTSQISDEDMKRYIGKTKAELGEWAKDRPGVGGNKNAGDITIGPASGLGGVAAADGYGGWGPGARPGNLKFPTKKKQAKTVEDGN